MSDQADSLRKLVRQVHASDRVPTPAAPVISVAGGRQAVGTSTVAGNLALALCRAGRATVLVDANLGSASLTTSWDAKPVATVLDVLAGRRTARESLVPGAAGVQLLCGSPRELPDPPIPDDVPAAIGQLVQELRRLVSLADVVVVDAGVACQPATRAWWLASDLALCVTTTDSVSVMDSYAGIKLAAQADTLPPLWLVVNRAAENEAQHVQNRIGVACQRFLELRPHHAVAFAESPLGADGAPLLATERSDSTLQHDAEALGLSVRRWIDEQSAFATSSSRRAAA